MFSLNQLSHTWRAFLKTPKDFRARRAILCVGYLPTEIKFLFVLKAKRKKILGRRETLHWFRAKSFTPIWKRLNFKNRFRARKVFGCFEKRTPGPRSQGSFFSREEEQGAVDREVVANIHTLQRLPIARDPPPSKNSDKAEIRWTSIKEKPLKLV